MRAYRFNPPAGEAQHAIVRSGSRRRDWREAMARGAALVVAGSGVLNLLSLMGGPGPAGEPAWARELLPLEFAGAARTLTLFAGFLLILTAANLWAHKRRAWQIAMAISGVAVVFHGLQGWDSGEALGSAGVVAALWVTRRAFAVGSERPRLGVAAARAVCAYAIAVAYGAAGFWLLEPREFHHNFDWWEAGARALRSMLFLGGAGLVPQTPYAAWFLDSLFWMSAAAFLYGGLALFRPVAYQFRHSRDESARAEAIAGRYGRTGQDYFKLWPDKSYFFSASGRSFLGYRVAGRYALVLGDPVGPPHELKAVVREFADFCRARGWRLGFHQIRAEHLPMYEALGFHRLKVGEDAIVDLEKFSLAGSGMKEFRNTVNRLDRLGYRVERIDPPLGEALLPELKEISDRWLEIPGHRERRFTLGSFERWYVRRTTVYVAFDGEGRPRAFLNLVPSYDPGVATVDLMRRGPETINGLMDYLFAKAFLDLKGRGVRSFNLGMAPLSGGRGAAPMSLEERLVHWCLKHLPSLFRADSLRQFKAKYADSWRPRYAVYGSRLDLARFGMALRRLSEIPERGTRKAA